MHRLSYYPFKDTPFSVAHYIYISFRDKCTYLIMFIVPYLYMLLFVVWYIPLYVIVCMQRWKKYTDLELK